MTKHDTIMKHIKKYYVGRNFTARHIAEDLGYQASNVSAYLCNMRYGEEIEHYLTLDNVNYYRLINSDKVSLEDVSDDELIAELKRRLVA